MSEPIISIGYFQDEKTNLFYAQMTVSHIETEQQAVAYVDAIQKMFCGEEIEFKQ